MYIDEENEEEEGYNMGEGAILTVSCDPCILINGALGQCCPIKNSGTYLNSKKVVGFGDTNRWYLGNIDKSKTITLVYEHIGGVTDYVLLS